LARLARDRASIISIAVVLGVVAVAAVGPLLAPYDPTYIDSSRRLAPPLTTPFVLGGDQQGRDILSRLLVGTRLSLLIGTLPVVLAAAFGVPLGILSGYAGRRVDLSVTRLLDLVLAFPAILLAIVIVTAAGPGIANSMLAMVIVAIPYFARITRSAVLQTKHQEFVPASRCLGASHWRMIRVDILPSIVSPLLVFSALETSRMILFGAGLSFLGLGVQPPLAEWGAMISDGRSVLPLAPHVATIPGVVTFVLALAMNALGDGLREAIDPRLDLAWQQRD
jgi:peptide/nickel transport system permease protein